MADKSKFDLAANFIVEDHARVFGDLPSHPDKLKEAIAVELKQTYEQAIYDVERLLPQLCIKTQ